MKYQQPKNIAGTLALILCSTFAVNAQAGGSRRAPRPPAEPSAESSDGSLSESVKAGDLSAIATLLADGTNPDQFDDEGGRPLCWAVRVNRGDIVELLLSKGANVNAEENDGSAPLDVAAAFGNAELVKLLLARGAVVNHKDHGGHTALIAAAVGATVKDMPPFLVQAMWGQEGTDKNNQLLSRMGKEYKRVTELLIQAGADVNYQATDCGMNALMFAALAGSVDLVEVLLKNGAKPELKNDNGDALFFAEALESPAIRNDLLKEEEEDKKQALIIWCQTTSSGRRQVAALLRAAAARK